MHGSAWLYLQEDAENTKFSLEQQVQQLEADLAAANLAKAAAGSAAPSAASSNDPALAETKAKLEAIELQLTQMQQQNERLAADRYSC